VYIVLLLLWVYNIIVCLFRYYYYEECHPSAAAAAAAAAAETDFGQLGNIWNTWTPPSGCAYGFFFGGGGVQYEPNTRRRIINYYNVTDYVINGVYLYGEVCDREPENNLPLLLCYQGTAA